MWFLSGAAMGKGGIFSARVHPRIKQILRGAKQEAGLRREGITRFNKRWRSWAIRTVRKHNLPTPVVLTSDPHLMDAEYLATCMQRAATTGVKDIELWRGYGKRFTRIAHEIPAQHFGYMVWAIGRVQLPIPSIYAPLVKRAQELVPELTSSGLMSVLWTLRRGLIKPPTALLAAIADRVLADPESIRPADYIKIVNCFGFFGFGKHDAAFRDTISEISMKKFEADTFAQDFRAAVDPLALSNVYNDAARGYVLDRFRKIFITARPNHLLSAYHSSVAVRVLTPAAWFSHLTEKTRGFYTSLAMRHIAAPSRGMSKFHKEVSESLAGPELKLAHRNAFRWGPLWIDIGIEDETESAVTDDRKSCIVLDKPSSFYANEKTTLTEKSKLEDSILSQVGWKVKHVNHYAWSKCRTPESRIALLKSVLV